MVSSVLCNCIIFAIFIWLHASSGSSSIKELTKGIPHDMECI
jgi:hypothetical protein